MCPIWYVNPRPTYRPAQNIIASITQGYPTVVTTVEPNKYLSGEIVRLVVPDLYGMFQINELSGKIVVTGLDTFSIDIDSTYFDPFVIPDPLPDKHQIPQVVPFAEINSQLSAAVRNVLREEF